MEALLNFPLEIVMAPTLRKMLGSIFMSHHDRPNQADSKGGSVVVKDGKFGFDKDPNGSLEQMEENPVHNCFRQ